MHYHAKPYIGNWYSSPEFEEIFEVVAFAGNHEELVEIQFFNGDLDELDEELWSSLTIIEVAPPDDWSGACEIAKEDFSLYMEETYHPESWDNPINTLDP